MGRVIGIIVVLAIAILLSVFTCKSKGSDLLKWIGIVLFVAFALTWVLPYGQFQGATFYEYGMNRLGFADIPNILYYSIYFCLTTIIYLLVLGGFYGVLSKTKGYSALVNKFAKSIKNKEVLVTILMTIILVALTAILKTQYILLIFVPFLISVLLNAKFDKLSAFSITFGSLLVGSLAAVYGTDGLYWFNNYASTKVTVGIIHRLILGIIALILFTVLNALRVAKFVKKNKKNNSDLENDPYEVIEVKGKNRIWPTIVVFTILFIVIILGYTNWETNFNIEAFSKFHTWLTGLTIGKDFTIFSYILGTNAVALGSFEISTAVIILLVLTPIIALANRMNASDFAKNFGEGFNKMFKPIVLYVLAYSVFIVTYLTPFMTYISDWAFGLTKKFNPYIVTLTSFVTSIFHSDLGYTSYLMSGYLSGNYAENYTLAHTLYISTYGLVQVLMPTSGLLLIGLSYLKIDYKKWFKHIWLFALIMLVVILIYATIVAYAM